ncbi:50S ribosomal protein L4 [archaeon]|nr:MAG: 50S ribosomal protein L4 [archaeon]
MKADVIDLQGKPVEKIELPKVFSEPVRADLILRAVLSSQSKRRQPYGTDPMAGKRSSAHYHGYRRHRYAMMGKEMARMSRLHGKTVPFMYFTARIVPQARGGREAFPPLTEKVWEQKMNDKERKKAIRSAIAATASREIVEKRGHRIDGLKSLPIIVDDKLQEITRTKDLVAFLEKIGLEKELERIQQKKLRPGKGKARGRKYKVKKGPLFVVADDKGIAHAVANITGCDTINVSNLSAEILAPGAMPGRLTIMTKSAVEKLGG